MRHFSLSKICRLHSFVSESEGEISLPKVGLNIEDALASHFGLNFFKRIELCCALARVSQCGETGFWKLVRAMGQRATARVAFSIVYIQTLRDGKYKTAAATHGPVVRGFSTLFFSFSSAGLISNFRIRIPRL